MYNDPTKNIDSIGESRSTNSYYPPSYDDDDDYDDDELDNMRGFDPPSEDDMDDMGMQRYMDNNDEEGWE